MMRDNTALVHLDLSFNKIGEQDTQLIMEDLASNQTCVGFHYMGNQDSIRRDQQVGKVDSLGFIRMEDNAKQHVSDQHLLIGLPSGNAHAGIKQRLQKYPKLDLMQKRIKRDPETRLGENQTYI